MFGIGTLLSWWTWLGIAADYALAFVLIVAGIYLAFVLQALGKGHPLGWIINPILWLLRPFGYILIVLGVAIACIAYGESVGAAKCEAAWKEKKYEARIARLEQEAAAKDKAAETAAKQAKEIAREKDATVEQLSDYAGEIGKLSDALRSCRRASPADDRRMCAILGPAAAGCKNPERLRPQR